MEKNIFADGICTGNFLQSPSPLSAWSVNKALICFPLFLKKCENIFGCFFESLAEGSGCQLSRAAVHRVTCRWQCWEERGRAAQLRRRLSGLLFPGIFLHPLLLPSSPNSPPHGLQRKGRKKKIRWINFLALLHPHVPVKRMCFLIASAKYITYFCIL